MKIYYSAAEGGFYNDAVHTEIPSDAVEITAGGHVELLQAQAAGRVIVADEDGQPQAVDPDTLLSFEQRKAQMLAALAATRWRRMQTVPFLGREALADDVTLGRVTATYLGMQLDADADAATVWKFGVGDFATLTLDDVRAYGLAIKVKMTSCFEREAILATQIAAAADVEALNAIDLADGWPA